MNSRQLLYIAIFTFIVAVVWVTSNINHSRSQVQIPPETQRMMEPLNPKFDSEIVNSL